ncbi:hypothetical protein C2759_04985 [Polynucleobacter sp. MG-Unter2-18]|uniref:hypothetical protein n=1 Tax=Polynucleobacter sp. MG-Unter2-18 TaxID=2081052 RepID=UPI001BFDFB1F|nr:hypothetical protein [Polynucleobacter sp. MG-Unter2-18]QWD95470.1 hypothetical protein C2759_04985 [Polynucleobacter sp. MG-Unter2-18]
MNTKIILHNRPNQTVTQDNFQCIDADIAPLKNGQVLVLNQWLSLDPYVRGRMSERKSYAPSMSLGDVVIGEGIGIVIDSQSDQFKAGDRVIGMLGWQTHAVMNCAAIKPIPQPPFSETWLLGAAGMPVHEKITENLQNAPQIFIDLLEGRCLGKQIIKLS